MNAKDIEKIENETISRQLWSFNPPRNFLHKIRIKIFDWLLQTGSWAISVHEDKYGPIFRIVDLRRHIDHGCFIIHQVMDNRWFIIK